MATIFLGLSALMWFPYGLFCFVAPGFLQQAAGIAYVTPTGTTELRAMYGGLQVAIGLLAFVGLQRPALRRGVIQTLFAIAAGLGIARLLGAAIDGGWSAYTILALIIEFGSAAWAGSLLRGGEVPRS